MPLFFLLALGGAALYLLNRESDSAQQDVSVIDTASEAVKNVVAQVKAVFPTPYDDLIRAAADQYLSGVPDGYTLLWNLLYTESRFREDIITGRKTSPVGALGIAQFMPATAEEQGVDPLNPASAIPGAARYLARLIQQAGSVDAGVAAYNWGIGNVKRKGLRAAPQETVDYVAAITGSDILA